MKLFTSDEKLYDELLLVVKLFYTQNQLDDDLLPDIKHSYVLKNNSIINKVEICNNMYAKHTKISTMPTTMQNTKKYKYIKRFSKLCLYEFLSINTGKKLPWGSLTGIRPTKLFYELLTEEIVKRKNKYLTIEQLCNKVTVRFENEFYVSKEKSEITKQIILNQNPLVKNDNLVDFYINIPFCPTRCSYCSFVSSGIKECIKYLDDYLNALIKEINATKVMLTKNKLTVKSVYIGGGTPTTLSPEQLDLLLSNLKFDVKEFTVESGRPDSITKEKFDVLKKHNVTRVCINPQTFNDDTLVKIGRNHTSTDTLSAYELAKKYPFTVNMDLIAGLPDENFDTFKKSLDKAISLKPDNITVHTLSIKKASILIDEQPQLTDKSDVENMIEYSYNALINCGYKPYYLYKQKNMIGNLENIGYYQNDAKCIFNIDSMEEVASIVACGANAISKRYFSKTDRIERWANVKNLPDYINRIDEMIANKNALFNK